MIHPALHGMAHALAALLLLALAGCQQDISLGRVDLGEGGAPGSSSSTSVGAGGVLDPSCTDKACGVVCSVLGAVGWCDGSGLCRTEYSCGLYDPCVGKSCGESCAPCPPDAPAADCPANGLSLACDLAGACRPAGFSCGPCDYNSPDCPYDPCLAQNLPCGAPCDPMCDSKDAACLAVASKVCNANHECRPELEVKCDPCVDAITQGPKLCGAECDPCDAAPWLACDRPFAPSGVTVCDGSGACVPPERFTACPASPAWEACGAASCGDACSLCDPTDPGCAAPQALVCNDAKQCVGAALCAYNDCADKACGALCSPCDPSDPFCAEQVKYCDIDLSCVLDQPGACR